MPERRSFAFVVPGGVALQRLLASPFQTGVIRRIEEQAPEMEGGGEPLRLLLGEGGLFAVVAFALGGDGQRPVVGIRIDEVSSPNNLAAVPPMAQPTKAPARTSPTK